MPDERTTPNDQVPEEPEEIEVVAHSDEEDEELNAGCQFNGVSQL